MRSGFCSSSDQPTPVGRPEGCSEEKSIYGKGCRHGGRGNSPGAVGMVPVTAAEVQQHHTRQQGDRAMTATEAYQQTIGTGSIPHVVNVAKRLLRHIDPSADVDELDMMAAHAEHEAASRREEVNAKVPPFASIVAKVHDYATPILDQETEDIDLLALSELVYILLQVCMLPGRERMLLSLRCTFSEEFTEDEDHAPGILDSLKIEHPAAADYLTLSV